MFLQTWKHQKAEAEALEAEVFNLRVLMDCWNQENLKKLKEVIQLSVYKKIFQLYNR